MCGIIGTVFEDGVTEDGIVRARDLMCSRGPDAAGLSSISHDQGTVWLGHRRLAIQDLSLAGAQPMQLSDSRYTIVYNGEVYNVAALRRQLEAAGHRFKSTSDTEVVLAGYAEWGADMVGKLNGMFAFAIWDNRAQCLFAARDRLGVKPFIYAGSPRAFSFASDARALRAIGLGHGIDQDALSLYLCLGYVPGAASIWTGLSKLEAGHMLEWRAGAGVTLRRYWTAPEDTDYEGGADDLEGLIEAVVQDHMLSDVPVGLFLSAGVDSSLIAASVAAGAGQAHHVTSISVGFPGNASADESTVAEKTARQLSLPFLRVPINETTPDLYSDAVATLDEPLAYNAVTTQVAISRATAEHGFKVVLSGDGGDEVFGGYRWYRHSLQEIVDLARAEAEGASPTEWLLAPRRRQRAELARDAEFMARQPVFAHARSVFPAFRPDQVADLFPEISACRTEELMHNALSRHDAVRLPEKRRRQRMDLYSFCQDVILPKVDRAGMAFGLEARPIYLDHRIVEWGLARPISDADDGAPKNRLRKLLQKKGLGALLEQPKRGFSLRSKGKLDQAERDATISSAAGELGLRRGWQRRLKDIKRPIYATDTLYLLSMWHRLNADSRSRS